MSNLTNNPQDPAQQQPMGQPPAQQPVQQQPVQQQPMQQQPMQQQPMQQQPMQQQPMYQQMGQQQVPDSGGLKKKRKGLFNRLFGKSFATRLTASLLLMTIVPLAIVGVISTLTSSQSLQAQALQEAHVEAELISRDLSTLLIQFSSDVLALSQTPPLQGMIRAEDNGGIDPVSDDSFDVWKGRLETIFVPFAEQKGFYQQLRVINENGNEVIRVDSDGFTAAPVLDRDLSNKSTSDYFTETMKLRDGEVYISAMNLNREGGVVTEPITPVLRYATPLFDSDGDRRGIMVLNVFAESILNQLNPETASRAATGVEVGGTVYLINSDGFYLKNPVSSEKEFGFDLENENYTALNDFGTTWINASRNLDLQEINSSLGLLISTEQIQYDPLNPDVFWVLMTTTPQAVALEDVTQLSLTIGGLALATAVVVAFIAFRLGTSVTRPILSLAEVSAKAAGGDLTVRSDIDSEDELGTLANSFNVMTAELQRTLTGMEATIDERTQDLAERAQELEARAVEMEASQRVTFAATERTSPEDLLNLIVNLIRDQFDLYHAQVYLLDESKENAVLRESTGYAGRTLLQRGHSIPMDQTALVTTAIKNNQPVLVSETTKDPNWLPNELLPETLSELVVPLTVEDEVIGAMDIQAREAGYFTERSVPLFAQMTKQVAFMFENASLLESVTEQTSSLEAFTEQLRAASEIGQRLNVITDSQELLDEAVNELQRRFGFYHAHIYLVDDENENLVVESGTGEVGRVLKERGHSVAMDRENSMVARTARTRGYQLANDVTEDPNFQANPLLPRTASELAIPLVSGEKLVGVLDIQDEQVNRFTTADIDTMVTLGGQIASTLETTRLFAEVEVAQSRMEGIINTASDAIISIDDEQKIVLFNKGAENAFGYTEEEIMGRHLEVLMPGRFSGSHERNLPEFAESGIAQRKMSPKVEVWARRKDGTEFPAETSISQLTIGDRRLFTAILRDTTDQLAAQSSLMQGDRLKSEFLANMSHELRTPLNSIIGYTDVLLMGLDGELDEEIMIDIQAINDNGQHLLSLINDILDLAKIEAGRMTLDVTDVNISRLLEDVKKNNDGLVANKPVEIKTDIAPNLPFIRGDHHRLSQVMTNLVSNAVKFTEQGSVTLRAMLSGNDIVMQVEDTGVGMAQDALDEIFEEFTQADSSSTRTAEGTGLGLTITRRLVQMHGGSIQAASELGHGSTFTIRIPLNAVIQAEQTLTPSSAGPNGAPRDTKQIDR